MSLRNAILALAAAWVCAAPAAAAAAPIAPVFRLPLFAQRRHAPPAQLVFDYHGWHVDASKGARGQSPDKTVKALKTQIDVVEHVGLKPQMLTAMRAAPILADPTVGREAGRYSAARTILLRVKRLDPKKPILLHALLLAYQDQHLPGGFGNPEISAFRAQAAARHVWPKNAVMLQSDGEFFAETASAYLYGEITREPYTRADLHKTQPLYYQWLARLFDDGRPRPIKPI
jgi:hypothetical protein